jgi:CheY-like chemotaxis protein
MDTFIETMDKFFMDELLETNKKSILIVDDDVTYMRTIRDWLKDDYKVSMANSGIQAITWLAKNKADLILLDYEMPVADGPKVLEMLHQDGKLSMVPVMFLTGKSDKDSVLKAASLKPVKYLLKSLPPKQLLDEIDQFFITGK